MVGGTEDQIRVLHVADDPNMVDVVATHLEREHEAITVRTETDPTAALAEIDESVSCIVSDYNMAGMDGLDFLRAVREEYDGLPFILLTGAGSEAIASEAVSAGVTEYFRKEDITGQYAVLANRIEGVVTDVTERKEREQRLEQFRTLVQNVGDPMYILDEDGTIQMANEAMATHLNHDIDEIVGQTAAAFMPEDDVRRGEKIIRELLQEEPDAYRTWEMDAILRDGGRIRNEAKTSIIYDDSGNFAGSVGVIRDITERTERERELERYETIIQAVGDPVYTLDEDGQFTFVNEAFESMTGYDTTELLGEDASLVSDADGVERGRQAIEELLQSEVRTTKYELTVVTADGEKIPCELQMALLPHDEEFAGTAGVVREITERKRREERLEEFVGVVAHDLRGPLNAMLGRVELAQQTGEDEHFRKILAAIERMDTLIDDLLTLAKQGRTVGETEPVELRAVAERAWGNIDADDGELHIESNPTLEADMARLREALENLFKNSIEHGTERSHEQAASGTPETRAEDIEIRTGELPEEDGFFVADDGPGIPSEQRDNVFERGFTTESNGTGFGLSIVESIVDAHDWEIDVTDSADDGARFDVITE